MAQTKAIDTGLELAGVIDVGSSSIRMAVAELLPDGGYRTLETLQQSVSLGKDVFMFGRILPSTTEACVEVLSSFRRLLREYQIEDRRSIRAVATSAVREASNRDAFLDRVYIATGINIEPVDEAEVNRLTYLSVTSLLDTRPSLKKGLLLIAEVGGGNTEVLSLQSGLVCEARTYRLGTLRLHERMEEARVPDNRIKAFLKQQVDSALLQFKRNRPANENAQVLFIGGEARFAAAQINPGWDRRSLIALRMSDLAKFTDRVLKMGVNEIVNRYHLPYSEAESLGPCLVAYTQIGRMMKLHRIWVGEVSLRDGLLRERTQGGGWSGGFYRQVVHSAGELGRKYEVDHRHAEHVTQLALQLYDTMSEQHQLPSLYRMILHVAGLLHDIGAYISNRSHHKHSMYLIRNSDLFGLSSRLTLIAALVARYHRRALPKPTHSDYSGLDRESRIVVLKLAALLRVADALDRGHTQRVKNLQIDIQPEAVILTVRRRTDLALEQQAMEEKGRMFEQVYGKRIVLRNAPTETDR